jgi:AcrR family transcriptional regulator
MAKSRSSKRERRSVREESRAVYRQAIVEAAMRIFGQTGFRDAKIADIAAEAGVATGTLYNYFSSKEEIFQSILDDGRERLAEKFEQTVSVEDPLARLREVVRVIFEFLEEHGALFSIYVQLGANPVDLRRREDCGDEAFRQQMLTLLIKTLREAGDRLRPELPAETLAWALGGLMNGAIITWVSDGCKPGLRQHTDTIMDLFLHGATPR